MSVSLAPDPLVAPASPSRPEAWKGYETTQLPDGTRWTIRRNCSVSPRQMGAFYLSLCAVSVAIGLFFAAQGAPAVLAFAGLELLAVGVALLVHARRCGDREVITLQDGVLDIEATCGGRVRTESFEAARARIEHDAGAPILVRRGANCLQVGGMLRPHRRDALARELRAALRREAHGAASPQF